MSAAEIEKRFVELPASEQVELLHRLARWMDEHGPAEQAADPAWEAELRRRMEEMERDETACLTHDEVFGELRARFR